ncbi:MAG: hypothetical protein ACMVY4_18625 [Minwuia sp.]|uniref:hypothetical protein n=1 Tax=Minwuia sp. TaxID=2493630 RepID=UPI003A855300
MQSRKSYVPKVKVQTLILMNDGTELEGSVFIRATQRVLDLMNEPGMFFPLACSRTGEITLVNKANINNIKPLE